MTDQNRINVTLSELPENDAINPYLGLIVHAHPYQTGTYVTRYKPFSRQISGDIFHMHWPEKLLYLPKFHRFAPAIHLAYANMIAAIDHLRARGGKLVWTAHNLAPHDIDAHRLAAVWRRWSPEFFARVDAVIAMQPSVRDAVAHAIPQLRDARFDIIPHPHYADHYAQFAPDPTLTRARLGVPDDALLVTMPGLVRGYKNIEAFIHTFNAVNHPRAWLLIAGACYDPELQARVQATADGSARVIFAPRALSEPEYIATIKLSDMIAMNFAASLNSGSIFSALSLGAAVLAPDLGAARDVAAHVGDQWLTLFDAPVTPDSLATALALIEKRDPATKLDLSAYNPDAIAQAHVALYRDLLHMPQR